MRDRGVPHQGDWIHGRHYCVQSTERRDSLQHRRTHRCRDTPSIYDGSGEQHGIVSAMSVEERIAETRKLKRYVMKNREQICDKVIRETGKSRLDALLTVYLPRYRPDRLLREARGYDWPIRKRLTPLILMGKKSYVSFRPDWSGLGHFAVELPFHPEFFDAMRVGLYLRS